MNVFKSLSIVSQKSIAKHYVTSINNYVPNSYPELFIEI